MVAIGAHVGATNPLAEAKELDAQAIQLFLGDPKGWKAPGPHPQAQQLQDSGLAIYIHAPYILNLASTNNRIRIPSRRLLAAQAAAAADVGARGLVVHGGHVTAADDPAAGVANWRKAFAEAAETGGFKVPILIENTAGGQNAMARSLDRLARLWDAVGEFGAGFCLDTCHAFSAGLDLTRVVADVMAITGRIDLVHANDSRDAPGSGADRHANLGAGSIGAEAVREVVIQAGCDAVLETPSDLPLRRAEIEFLRGAQVSY